MQVLEYIAEALCLILTIVMFWYASKLHNLTKTIKEQSEPMKTRLNMDIYDTAGQQIAKAFNDRAHILEMIKLELENNMLTIQIRAQQAFALSEFMRGINEQWLTPCKTNYKLD